MTRETCEQLLTPAEVAAMFRVDPKTVTRWASAGRIGSLRTPGGRRRYRESEVRNLLHDQTPPLAVPSPDNPSTPSPAPATHPAPI